MIDKNKTYKTRAGEPVRIYATDGLGERPIHGAFLRDGYWMVACWPEDGICFTNGVPCIDDLVEATA